jgi:hypothetical protein
MYVQQDLVRDGSLVLSVDETVRSSASEWMPSLPERRAHAHPEGASIRVDPGELAPPFRLGAAALALGNVAAWLNDTRSDAWLENASRAVRGHIDLERRVARITIGELARVARGDVTATLTIAAALLLVRDARTAIHSAGVAHPITREAWLLVADSHSGKSTTTANLIRAGWYYLSDDYVVLSRSSSGEIEVEGWPDDFHLDEGWRRGESTGIRATLREEELPQGRRLSHAPLGGLLFPRVSSTEETIVFEVEPVFSLERLIRQSPWLVADTRSAGKVFELLSEAASVPAGELRLGLDTFADPEKLSSILGHFVGQAR